MSCLKCTCIILLNYWQHIWEICWALHTLLTATRYIHNIFLKFSALTEIYLTHFLCNRNCTVYKKQTFVFCLVKINTVHTSAVHTSIVSHAFHTSIVSHTVHTSAFPWSVQFSYLDLQLIHRSYLTFLQLP